VYEGEDGSKIYGMRICGNNISGLIFSDQMYWRFWNITSTTMRLEESNNTVNDKCELYPSHIGQRKFLHDNRVIE